MNKEKKNVVSIEDRIPKLKEARRKKANRRLVFYMTIFFLLISIIVYLQSPLSEVKTVTVYGNSFISDEEIIQTSGFDEKMNIWAIDFAEIEGKLEENPVIAEADVKRKLPSSVDITVLEKDIVGFMEKETQYYPVLESGEVLSAVGYETFTGEAPLLVGFSEDELTAIATELSNLSNDLLDLISEVHPDEDGVHQHSLLLYMNDGFIVKGTIRDIVEGMTVYPSVVSQLEPDVKGIIHMGVGVYFEAFQPTEESDDDRDGTEE